MIHRWNNFLWHFTNLILVHKKDLKHSVVQTSKEIQHHIIEDDSRFYLTLK